MNFWKNIDQTLLHHVTGLTYKEPDEDKESPEDRTTRKKLQAATFKKIEAELKIAKDKAEAAIAAKIKAEEEERKKSSAQPRLLQHRLEHHLRRLRVPVAAARQAGLLSGRQARRGLGHALGEVQHVGHDAEIVRREVGAHAPEAGDDLVEDQQDAVLVADLAQPLQVALGRDQHAGRARDRLDDDGGDGRGVVQIDEAFERIGRDASSLSANDIDSARRSLSVFSQM